MKSALRLMRSVFSETPLELNSKLSNTQGARIFLKREDLGIVRSYKLRGALNKMSSLNSSNPVITCSAGNHAQGVAWASSYLGIPADIYMPLNTTKQKIDRVKFFGQDNITIHLKGDTFDECATAAKESVNLCKREYIHPFDDQKVIEGQATVGMEIVDQMEKFGRIDYLIMPVGGGGLAAGVSSFIKDASPHTRIIGVEPMGAASLTHALKMGFPAPLSAINTFVDGASVKQVGTLNFPLLKAGLDEVLLVDEGHVCSKIIEMYNENGLIIEPAGVLSLCALDLLNVEGKNVVCVISGGNSDVYRMPEILERSLIFEGKKHFFRIEFPQRAGALRDFISKALGPSDDIIYFRYTNRINKETGPVLIGVESKTREDSKTLLTQMRKLGINFTQISSAEL